MIGSDALLRVSEIAALTVADVHGAVRRIRHGDDQRIEDVGRIWLSSAS